MSIKAIVVDHDSPANYTIKEIDDPKPLPNETVVRVHATSLNSGEVKWAQNVWPNGYLAGWDLAGVVEHAATDGSGPKVGERVVGFVGAGAWAQKVAVKSDSLGAIPESVTFEQAATLPVAGLTAYHALTKRGSLLGRNVLVTGASGGVGGFAVQLAKIAGATVTGQLRSESKRGLVESDGADFVVVNEDVTAASVHGPFDLVVESVGGSTLGGALGMLAKYGAVSSFAASGDGKTTYNTGQFFGTGGTTLYGVSLFTEIISEPAGATLTFLSKLVADGKLTPHIDKIASWTEVGALAKEMLDHKLSGKAVLVIE